MDPLPTPLVSTAWLTLHLGEPGLVVVDASWYLAAMNRNGRAEYEAGHIPGALYWDLDELSDRSSALPHMLPPLEELEREIGLLGIGNEDRVVVYDGSGTNLSAARVWWTLRLLGHSAVAVLDGGLKRWRAEGHPVQAGRAGWQPKAFKAVQHMGLMRNQQQTVTAIQSGAAQIVDARSSGRFAGTEPEPRAGLRGGHMPEARSLPFAELTGSDGMMLSPDDMRRRFQSAGADLERPVILTCGSGVTACVLALGLEVAGHRNYGVYDGSWSEWGRLDGPPVETGPAR